MDVNNQDVVCVVQFLFPGEAGRTAAAEVMQSGHAERVCRVKYAEGEHSQDVWLQVLQDRIVVTGTDEEDTFGYTLHEPEQIKRACHYLFNCFDYSGNSGNRTLSVPALILSGCSIEELLRQADSCSLYVLAECLGAECGDPLSAAELAKTLKSCTASGEVRLCSRNSSGWSLQRASFIEDAAGGWLLRVSCETAQEFIIAFPFTKAEMCQAFYEWIMYPAAVRHQE